MSLSVQTNLASLIAQNALDATQGGLATTMQRLSTGLRIDSAADGAAGLAISTGMQSQIDGDTVAVRNANDGVSLVQTAGSALSQVTHDLQTIRSLAVEAANATETSGDRQKLNSEVQQELAEITRIANQTTYNGKHLLDGTFGNGALQIGANNGQVLKLDLGSGFQASQIGEVASAVSHPVAGSAGSPGGLTLGAGDLFVDGQAVTGHMNAPTAKPLVRL